MGKQNNIEAKDLNTNLLEAFIANQKQIIQEFNRLHKRLDRMEAQLCLIPIEPTIEKEFYNTKETMEKLGVSRGTLFTLKSTGKIGCTQNKNTIRFSRENIEEYKKAKR